MEKLKVAILTRGPGSHTFPILAPNSLHGIISFLTQKAGGNVHEKGVVKLTSSSVSPAPDQSPADQRGLEDVVNLESGFHFFSKSKPGQWVCWDFGEMRVRLDHYTIIGHSMKSWILHGSRNGDDWWEIDKQTDIQGSKNNWNPISFAVANPAEFRFIRLTQTAKRHAGDDVLGLQAVEFFGILFD
jgi:hypothetical protein